MKENCSQFSSVFLTAVIGYQAYYNYKANEEMGGKYQKLDHVIYSFYSLLPGIALGLYATRLSFTDKSNRDALLQKRFLFDLIALFYSVLAFLFAAENFWRKESCPHQNGPWQYIHSDWSSSNHDTYYFGVLQYGPAVLLTISYMRHFGMIFTSKKQEHKCCHKQPEMQIDYTVRPYQQATPVQYSENLMV